MQTLGIFCMYTTTEGISNPVKLYLTELRQYFTDMILVMNRTALPEWELQFLESLRITPCLVNNEGYDFGMYYRVFQKFDCTKYDHIGLVNDSTFLFRPLKHVFNTYKSGNYDYFGIVSSPEISLHIQSYFLLFNKATYPLILNYMNEQGIKSTKEEVVEAYEVGICTMLRTNGKKLGCLLNHTLVGANNNPTIFKVNELIKLGMPMVKKSLVCNKATGGLRNFLHKHGTTLNMDLIKECPDAIPFAYESIMMMVD